MGELVSVEKKEAEEIMIDMGDIVRLANERFVVK